MFIPLHVFSGFAVNDISAAKEFYSKILNFQVEELDMGLLMLKFNSKKKIIIYNKPDLVPANFTILNFEVENIEEAVKELGRRGVRFEVYEGSIKTDEQGICREGDGPWVAWFKDPSGNILSVLQNKYKRN